MYQITTSKDIATIELLNSCHPIINNESDDSLLEMRTDGGEMFCTKRHLGLQLNDIPIEVPNLTFGQKTFLKMNDQPLDFRYPPKQPNNNGVMMTVMYDDNVLQVRLSLQQEGTGCFWVDGYVLTGVLLIE